MVEGRVCNVHIWNGLQYSSKLPMFMLMDSLHNNIRGRKQLPILFFPTLFVPPFQNGGFEYISREDPDIFCLQEIKCAEDELPKVDITTVHACIPRQQLTPPCPRHIHIANVVVHE